ncbi:MAG TPA: DUF5615 family PIN-like protein [Longimicrobiaceae bacterium]|nr:DUF5615 family PIN-like protein [Longimicrobiaceae bacterium]
MIFVCDEGVDRTIVLRLREDGHDVLYVAEMAPGIPDEEVLREANARGAILVTLDKDFGELVFRLGRATHGVLLIRLQASSTEERALRVVALVRSHEDELPGAFTVLSASKVRIRKHG